MPEEEVWPEREIAKSTGVHDVFGIHENHSVGTKIGSGKLFEGKSRQGSETSQRKRTLKW